MSAGRRAVGVLDHLEEGFMAVALAFMTIITFVQVCLRYLFGTGFVWSLEATTYTFGWLVLVGMSYGVRTQTHIAVDALTTKLSPAAQRAVGMLALLLCLGYCALMFYGSYLFVDRLAALGNNARDIPLPRWLLTLIMPIAYVLLGFRFVQASWEVLTGRSTSAHAAPHR